MSIQNWLSLMEYSAKYRVSLSTLRRRIKAGEIEHKLHDGKYLLKDGPLEVVQSGSEAIAPPPKVSPQIQSAAMPVAAPAAAPALAVAPAPIANGPSKDEFWVAAQTLLSEIKKAYSLILQEKEEQILQLKEEVADLKTLVRVLEDENGRIKNLQPKLDFDLGLEL